MKWFVLLTIVIFLLFTGCIYFDCGYTPNNDIHEYSVSDKYPITFSVTICKEKTDIVADPDVDDISKKIEDRLKATNLFSEVVYVSQKRDDGYHIDFNFHLGGTDFETGLMAGYVGGCTLLTIPVWEDCFLDLQTQVYAKQRLLFSVCSSEKGRCIVWLPLLPFSIFANAFTCMHSLENSVINDVINNISKEHIQRYLQ